MNRNSIAPDFIKFAAVIVAMPRWVLALLAADGYRVPQTWLWVHAVSAVFGAAMTILEGIAVAYVLGALVRAAGRQVAILGALVLATCATFAGVLTPSVYARVTGEEIRAVLPAYGIWAWSACVALSTVATVAAVGYAQAVIEGGADLRATLTQANADLTAQDAQIRALSAQVSQTAQTEPHHCAECPRTFASQQALAAHIRHAHRNGRDKVAELEHA